MTETKGHCKHGEFLLTEGCTQCIEESRSHDRERELEPFIVKVKYFSESTGELSGREYTYYSVDHLNVGDIVIVPVRDTTSKAKVTAIDVPESEIASFKDKVKTIPSGSIVKPKADITEEPLEETHQRDFRAPEPLSEEARRVLTGGRDEMIRDATETAIALRPGEDFEAHGYHEEAIGLLKYAEDRVIATAEDDKLANDDLVAIGKLTKAMEAKRVSMVKPMQEEVKIIQETYKTLMAPVLEADRITRDKMKSFKLEQQRIAREVEEVNRQALEVARKQAAMNNGQFTTDIKPVEVETAPRLARTDQGTSGLVEEWKYEVTDINLLPREYMMPNTVLLNDTAKKYHDKNPVPGVRFYNDPHVAVRESKR